MKAFRLSRALFVLVLFLSLTLTVPAYSASLSLVVATDRDWYNVGDDVIVTGSVSNGSAVPDALVLFEVDTPNHDPWIIRTFTTGQTPAGPWSVQLLSVTPCDSAGNPKYSFTPGQDAGFTVTLKSNSLNPNHVLATINLFFSNGLPFLLRTAVNTTLDPGQSWSTRIWPVTIPRNSVVGQAMVYASAFNDYPKNSGLPYSPEQSAAFNITSGVPFQTPQSSAPGTFNFTATVISIPSMPIWLGNYTVYATTFYGFSIASAQANFTVKLIGDMDCNGKIDITDVATVSKAFGTRPGNPRWNPAADISGPIPEVPDGKVDITDVALVSRAFGVIAIPAP